MITEHILLGVGVVWLVLCCALVIVVVRNRNKSCCEYLSRKESEIGVQPPRPWPRPGPSGPSASQLTNGECAAPSFRRVVYDDRINLPVEPGDSLFAADATGVTGLGVKEVPPLLWDAGAYVNPSVDPSLCHKGSTAGKDSPWVGYDTAQSGADYSTSSSDAGGCSGGGGD